MPKTITNTTATKMVIGFFTLNLDNIFPPE